MYAHPSLMTSFSLSCNYSSESHIPTGDPPLNLQSLDILHELGVEDGYRDTKDGLPFS